MSMGRRRIIHVNSHVIKRNVKWGDRAAPLTVKDGSQKIIDRGLEILIQSDPPVLVKYSPDQPLKCGARIWIETEADVGVRHLGETIFQAPSDAGGSDDTCLRGGD